MAGSPTGTGKTAGFTLPMLQRLMGSLQGQPTLRALVLTPTRKLQLKCIEDVKTYGKYPFKS